MPIRDQEAFLRPAAAAVRFLCNRGANGIDGLVSAGIGAAAASGRPTWIVTGDLGLFHDMNALAALGEASTPVRIVALDNRGGGIFEFLPQAGQIEREEFETLFGTPVDIELSSVAALHGLRHRRVESLADLGPAGQQTELIEVPVERSSNVDVHRRITEAATAAVEQVLETAS
jgi:2-succinyl-5-enolpyruvyl-6-hydroxy-3-cyclohexene-1-carboxylate synthase